MIWQFIGAILLIVIGIIGLCYCAWKDSDITIVSVIGFIMAFSGGCWLIGLIGWSDTNVKPKAIDVYREKTTLQITYQDSIAMDTIVVWKPEFDPNVKNE